MADKAEKLREFLREVVTESGYKNATISVSNVVTGNAGYTGDLYVATVSAPHKKDLQLFAKVANLSKNLRAINDIFSLCFEIERFFYADVCIIFNNLYNKHAVHSRDRLYVPKLYGFKSTIMEETLVLENLNAIGFSTLDRKKCFDWDYASKAVEELSKFHAIGLVFGIENRDNLDQVYKKSQINWLADKKAKDAYLSQAIKIGTQRVKEEYRNKMQTFFSEHKLVDDMSKLWSSSVGGFLIHGEYRHMNLMHRHYRGKLDIVPIDYQTYRLGMLAFDLIHFIWFGSDEDFRRHHYDNLIKLYYQKLTKALLNLNIDINNVYPRAMFERELENVNFLGLFIGLTMVPLTTLDDEDRPKYEKFEDIVMIEPNQQGLQRINGIVGDYIKWGLI